MAPNPYHNMPIHQDEHHLSQSMQPPQSPPIPLDPALALYPPSYYPYQATHHQMPQQLSLGTSLSSPSSQASDAVSTPPQEMISFAGPSKRPASANMNGDDSSSRKRAREDDEAGPSPSADSKEEPKAKPTRGSRACTVCRRLKMKCVGAEQGPPCKRCLSGNHECIFEESNRGKRSSNSSTRKHELLTRSLRKMERTLDTVLRSIGNPSIASGMISRSPSPSLQQSATSNFLSQTEPLLSASPPPTYHQDQQPQPSNSPKLHSLPDNALNPLGLLVEASLANRRAQSSTAPATSSMSRPAGPMGVASDSYFKPGPMTILPLRRLFIERQIQPEMLNFTETHEVVALFKIYFDHVNMHCNVLDPAFHTPSLVCSRSPFLLTVICAIASKFYPARPELHPKLSDLARKMAFNVPAQGYKSVEIVQAYLLMTLWGCGPVERYEQDKTWLILGLAIRMATDLNLHRKTATISLPTEEGKARDREVHNRERTWLLCYALDRSASAQMGKPSSVREDHIIRNAVNWARTSPLASIGDWGIVCYVELQRILSRGIDLLYSDTNTSSGLLIDCDYLLIVRTIDREIEHWYSSTCEHNLLLLLGTAGVPEAYSRAVFRFYANYAMLVVNSFGLQNALERTPVNIPHFFARVHTAAKSVALIVRDELGAGGFLKYSPDSHFVFGSYAVLSLLKLIRPEFPASLDVEDETLALVGDVADMFDAVAAGPLHTPALYSHFLRALLAARNQAKAGAQQDAPQSQSQSQSDQPADSSAGAAAAAAATTTGTGAGTAAGTGTRTGASETAKDADPPAAQNQNQFYTPFSLSEFQFASEMGPVADMSTFPPTMAAPAAPAADDGVLSMDSILSGSFWDNVLVPGYANPMEGLSGGFVYGSGGSGFITPHFGPTPHASGANSPERTSLGAGVGDFAQAQG
ncbi:hypothetical protein DENSPDRAFT_834825 [Dentipellis sp. KUC8613]|nr:hypothetical protein DENSPDRAFT_834825 [Dentipellis sp. KUC8613]